MSLTLFSKSKGQVAVFADPALPATLSFRMDNWKGFAAFKAIITRVAVNSSGNFQALHTLGGDAFIYVFGDRVGQIIISGLAFDSICNDPAGTLGVERIKKYYDENRLAARKTPIKITLGASLTLKGYLGGVNYDVEDVASRIWRFSFVLLEVPPTLPKLPQEGALSSITPFSPGSSSSGSGSIGDLLAIPESNFKPPSQPSSSIDSGGYDPSTNINFLNNVEKGLDPGGTGPSLSVRGFSLD